MVDKFLKIFFGIVILLTVYCYGAYIAPSAHTWEFGRVSVEPTTAQAATTVKVNPKSEGVFVNDGPETEYVISFDIFETFNLQESVHLHTVEWGAGDGSISLEQVGLSFDFGEVDLKSGTDYSFVVVARLTDGSEVAFYSIAFTTPNEAQGHFEINLTVD